MKNTVVHTCVVAVLLLLSLVAVLAMLGQVHIASDGCGSIAVPELNTCGTSLMWGRECKHDSLGWGTLKRTY